MERGFRVGDIGYVVSLGTRNFETRHLKMKMNAINILLLAVAIFLLGQTIRENQLGPHHYRNSIAGHVFDERELTNPVYITSEVKQRIGASGTVEFYSVQKTNNYWKIWSIWK